MGKGRTDDEAPRRHPRDDDELEDRRAPSRRRDQDEDEDDRPRRKKSKGGALSGIIPYRNGMALTAYYTGFAGLITMLASIAMLKASVPQANSRLVLALLFAGGGFLALLAIFFGILGLRSVSSNPDAKGTGHAITGIAMGALEIIGLLALLLIGLEGTIAWLSLK